jgi:hypothetical protein
LLAWRRDGDVEGREEGPEGCCGIVHAHTGQPARVGVARGQGRVAALLFGRGGRACARKGRAPQLAKWWRDGLSFVWREATWPLRRRYGLAESQDRRHAAR